MPKIYVKKNESLDNAIKRFNRSCQASGVVSDLNKKRYYQSSNEKRKKKSKTKRRKQQNGETYEERKKIKKEVIEMTVNGEPRKPLTLDGDCPSLVMYIENSDYAIQQAKGLTEEENRIEIEKRAAIAFFDSLFDTLDNLNQSAPHVAEELIEELGIEDIYYEDDEDSVYLGQGVYCTKNAMDVAVLPDQIVLEGFDSALLYGFEETPLSGFDIDPAE